MLLELMQNTGIKISQEKIRGNELNDINGICTELEIR